MNQKIQQLMDESHTSHDQGSIQTDSEEVDQINLNEFNAPDPKNATTGRVTEQDNHFNYSSAQPQTQQNPSNTDHAVSSNSNTEGVSPRPHKSKILGFK